MKAGRRAESMTLPPFLVHNNVPDYAVTIFNQVLCVSPFPWKDANQLRKAWAWRGVNIANAFISADRVPANAQPQRPLTLVKHTPLSKKSIINPFLFPLLIRPRAVSPLQRAFFCHMSSMCCLRFHCNSVLLHARCTGWRGKADFKLQKPAAVQRFHHLVMWTFLAGISSVS